MCLCVWEEINGQTRKTENEWGLVFEKTHTSHSTTNTRRDEIVNAPSASTIKDGKNQ